MYIYKYIYYIGKVEDVDHLGWRRGVHEADEH